MGKPAYDLFIDDKNISSDEYFKYYPGQIKQQNT